MNTVVRGKFSHVTKIVDMNEEAKSPFLLIVIQYKISSRNSNKNLLSNVPRDPSQIVYVSQQLAILATL